MRSESCSRIYFFTPFFGYTGSEIALFNLVVRIKDLEVIVISKGTGMLASRLPESVRYYDYESFKTKHHYLYRLKRKLGLGGSLFDYFLDQIIEPEGSLFYVNTILMPDVVSFLIKNKYRFALHAHELQQMLSYLKTADLRNIITKPEYLLTSSETCKRLWQTLGRKKNIDVAYPGVHIDRDLLSARRSELRARLNIKENVFVVGMSGTLDSNKNPEAFLEIGRLLRSRGLDVHLLWIGMHQETAYTEFLACKTKEYELENSCTWLSKIDGPEYLAHLDIVDCFVLTSIKESFSIVLVEALGLGKPVVSFKSGGPEEIIDDDSIGILIDGHSPELMANAVEQIVKGETIFDTARSVSRAEQFSPDVAFAEWLKIMKPLITASSS